MKSVSRCSAFGMCLLALLSTQCAQPTQAAFAEPEGLSQCAVRVPGDRHIAALLPFEGALAIGPSLQAAAIQALHEVNEGGGVTADGLTLGLVVCNTRGDRDTAVRVMREVIALKPKILAVIGPIDYTSFNAAAQDALRQTSVVIVSPVADFSGIAGEAGNAFRFGASFEALATGALAAGGPGRRGMIQGTDGNSAAFAGAFKDFLQNPPEAYEQLDITAANLKLDQIENYRSSIVYLIGEYEDAALILDLAADRDMIPTWVLPPWLKRSEFVEAVQDQKYLREKVVGVGPSYTRRPEHLQFADAYRDIQGEKAPVYTDHVYDATFALAMAVHTASTLTASGVRSALQSLFTAPADSATPVEPGQWEVFLSTAGGPVSYRGATGPLVLDEDGNRAVDVETWSVQMDVFRTEDCVSARGGACE
ncbi:MAG TPA: ABC transporter substrate-binding protein [Polyangiaceae bacterium]|nr:ABC transporter substrate-binding protein [Polyangiaceae bacterium]